MFLRFLGSLRIFLVKLVVIAFRVFLTKFFFSNFLVFFETNQTLPPQSTVSGCLKDDRTDVDYNCEVLSDGSGGDGGNGNVGGGAAMDSGCGSLLPEVSSVLRRRRVRPRQCFLAFLLAALLSHGGPLFVCQRLSSHSAERPRWKKCHNSLRLLTAQWTFLQEIIQKIIWPFWPLTPTKPSNFKYWSNIYPCKFIFSPFSISE